jgi:hypothetical protein
MTADYNPTEAQRLIANALEDDKRMTPVPWSAEADCLYSEHDGTIKLATFTGGALVDDDAAVARSRNNLKALADQLEAARREVNGLKRELASMEVTHDSLRADLGPILVPEQTSWSDHDLRLGATRLEAAWQSTGPVPVRGMVDLAEVVGDIKAKRDEYRQQLEAAQREAAHPCIHNPCNEASTGIRSDRTHAGEVEALSAAQRRIAELERERDSLIVIQRASGHDVALQLLAAQRRIAELETELARAEVANASLIPDAIVAVTDVECTRVERDALSHNAEARNSSDLESAIKVKDQRIAVLEADRAHAAEAYEVRGQRVTKLEGVSQQAETERDAYRAMLCDLLANAHPHPVEHPEMTRAWSRARELLKNGPPSVEKLETQATYSTLGAALDSNDKLESDLAAAQRRIAELESITLSPRDQEILSVLVDDVTAFGIGDDQDRVDDQFQRDTRALLARLKKAPPAAVAIAALRAIYPVYRAAREVITNENWLTRKRLQSDVDTARAAITPEINAVVAGLETSNG